MPACQSNRKHGSSQIMATLTLFHLNRPHRYARSRHHKGSVDECLQIHPMYAEPQFSPPKRSNTLPSYAQVESPNAHHKRDDSFPMVDFDPRKQANEENGLRPSRPTPDRKPSRPFYDQDGVSLPLRQSLQSATLFGMSPSLQAKLDKPSAWLGQSLACLSDYR